VHNGTTNLDAKKSDQAKAADLSGDTGNG